MPDTCPTYEDICTFCDEVAGRPNRFNDFGLPAGDRSYILLESDRFVVVPCIGALTDWYVLIVPRRHVLSVGWMDRGERLELKQLLKDVSKRLIARSGDAVVIFEHGSYSFRDKGGACHDHAHIHVVATPRNPQEFRQFVSDTVTLRDSDDWVDEAAAIISSSARSYLALSYGDNGNIGDSTGAPSGFFRKALLSWLEADAAEHDWLVFPQKERVRAMIHGRI